MIINRRSQHAVLLSFSLFATISTSNAEQATLTDDLKDLHIPVIKLNDQYVWAKFERQDNPTNPITFTVKEYGTLPERLVAPELHDINEVTDGLSPAIVDITPNQARLTFVSTIPLACSVIYGKTKSFGSVSTDANMNSGAIINHNPLLTDLDPDTLYYYRVQGTDAQGKLYWSPYGQFTTTATLKQNPVPATLNLLSLDNGATVTAVSSNYGNAQNDQAWGANKAIDGARAAWSSNGDGDNAFIEITLAQPTHVGNFEVWSRSMSDGSAIIKSFTITIDNGHVIGPYTVADTAHPNLFNLNRLTSSMRLHVVSSTGGNTGLIEFTAFAQ